MDNQNTGKRLRERLLGSQIAYLIVNLAIFIFTALVTALTANALGAETWFSTVMGITTGVLSYCCVRTWLDEDTFDAPDSNIYVILAGALAFIGMMLAYITMQIFPFGDHTVLIIDMHHQYVAFFALLRDKITSFGSFIYSDSLGLGGGFLPLLAYYLASPFNLITLFFPREYLTDALTVITLLKITAAGVTFAIFVKKFFSRNDFSVTVGGLAYAMISFFVAHSWNLMWLDPIILLPLVVLGLERLLRHGKPLLYCVTLACALITNYYIGYMVCVFLVFYYFAHVLADGRKLAFADRIQRFWRFCYGSLIGGGISAVMILPAFIYLQSTSGADDAFARAVDSNFPLFHLFQRTLFGSYPSMRGDALPNIYCSVLALFALILFFTCSKISVRKRLAWCGLVGVVAVGMSINWTNFAWHGFHFPNDLPYRCSFLMSFAMLCVLVQLLHNIDKVTPKNVLLAGGVLVAMLMAEQFWGEATFQMIYVSLAFIVVYALIVGLRSAGVIKQALCYALLLVFLFVEVGANSSLLLKQLDANEFYTERPDFNYDYEVDSKAFAAVESYEDYMYRADLLPRKTCNDPSLFGYSGLTVFASSNTQAVTTLMGKMGYAINGVNSYLYQNFVPVTDSILGLKYLVLGHEIGTHEQLVPLGSVTDTNGINTRYIYQNKLALSKAYMVSYAMNNWDWNNANPFHVQNSFITNATGTESVYDMINIFASTDPEGVETPTATIEGFNAKVDVSGSYFSCTQESEGLDTTFTVSQDITEDGQYYIYLDCRAAENMTVRAGETSVSSNPTEPHIVDLGYLYTGTPVEITVDTEMSCCGNFYLAKTDLAAIQMAFDRLADAQLEVTSYKEGKIEGVINNENDGLMFTSIPYDKGWTVKVDGEKVENICIGDALLAFEVPAGEHTVSMTYFPTGLIIGLVITLICIFLLVVLSVSTLREKAEKILFPLLPKRKTPVYEEGEYVIYDDDFDGDFEDFEEFEDYEQSEEYGDDDLDGDEAEGASAESDD